MPELVSTFEGPGMHFPDENGQETDQRRLFLETNQPNFFTPAFFAAFCKPSSSVASGKPLRTANSK